MAARMVADTEEVSLQVRPAALAAPEKREFCKTTLLRRKKQQHHLLIINLTNSFTQLKLKPPIYHSHNFYLVLSPL